MGKKRATSTTRIGLACATPAAGGTRCCSAAMVLGTSVSPRGQQISGSHASEGQQRMHTHTYMVCCSPTFRLNCFKSRPTHRSHITFTCDRTMSSSVAISEDDPVSTSPGVLALPFGAHSRWFHGRIQDPAASAAGSPRWWSLLAVQLEDQCPCLTPADGSFYVYDALLLNHETNEECSIPDLAKSGGALCRLHLANGGANFAFEPSRLHTGATALPHLSALFPEIATHFASGMVSGAGDKVVVVEGTFSWSPGSLSWGPAEGSIARGAPGSMSACGGSSTPSSSGTADGCGGAGRAAALLARGQAAAAPSPPGCAAGRFDRDSSNRCPLVDCYDHGHPLSDTRAARRVAGSSRVAVAAGSAATGPSLSSATPSATDLLVGGSVSCGVTSESAATADSAPVPDADGWITVPRLGARLGVR
jgi:hypothetical protein